MYKIRDKNELNLRTVSHSLTLFVHVKAAKSHLRIYTTHSARQNRSR